MVKYISSQEIKARGGSYPGIEKMTPWVVKEDALGQLLRAYYPRSEGACLDIGCGSGTAMLYMRPFFSEIYGIDLTSYLTKEAKEVVRFSAIDVNFEKLPFPDCSMDVVTAFQVIEHLENPFFVMSEAHRVLKSEGLFIISIPNPFQITFRLKFLFSGNMPPWTKENKHLLFLTRDVFAKTYLAKFDLVDTLYQKGAIPFWGRLRLIFGKKLIKRHAMFLPRSEWFARRVCYVLRKKSEIGL